MNSKEAKERNVERIRKLFRDIHFECLEMEKKVARLLNERREEERK